MGATYVTYFFREWEKLNLFLRRETLWYLKAEMSSNILRTTSGITLYEIELTEINIELLIINTAENLWVQRRLCKS
jgi:hypothetical protein